MSDENGEQKKTVHRVEISRSAEVDSLQKEKFELEQKLKDKEGILQDLAMKDIGRRKEELKTQYPQAKSLIDSCTDGRMLEDLESNLKDSYGTGKHAPYGKSSIIPPKGVEEYENQAQMVDSLYDRAYYNSRKYTPEEVEDAKQKIDQLLKSMIGGSAWKEMRERGTSPIEKHKLSACPKCHYTLVDTSKCSNCGYDATEKQKVRD